MSKLLLDVVPGLGDRESVLFALEHEVVFEQWLHKGGPLPRLCAEQGEMQEHCRPIYRHPIDLHGDPGVLPPFTPTVGKIKSTIEELLHCKFNYCLLQLYRSGADAISEHSDKTLDIAQDSVIVNYSVGATRTLILRKKEERDAEDKEETLRFALKHNSLFVLSLQMNREYTHQIKADKRAGRDKAQEEMGPRISLTFRLIATFYNLEQKVLFGQGAPRKAAARTSEGAEQESVESQERRLLQAFREENKTSKSWEDLYGSGFRVLGIVQSEAENPLGSP